MWPTFYIPAVAPGAPTPVNYDCWFEFTRYSDLTRGYADGIIPDPVLQFETEPNTAYWIFGYLKFGTVSRTGYPVVRVESAHTGDTAAFFSRSAKSIFAPPDDAPIYDYAISNGIGHLYSVTDSSLTSPVTDPHVAPALLDLFLVTGATGGVFSIDWGIANNVAGQSKINAGSTLVIRKPVEVI